MTMKYKNNIYFIIYHLLDSNHNQHQLYMTNKIVSLKSYTALKKNFPDKNFAFYLQI